MSQNEDGSPIPDSAKEALGEFAGEFFDDVDLENARWRYATPDDLKQFEDTYGFEPSAFTDGNDIYINPNKPLDLTSPGGLARMAHELTHVKQFRTNPRAGARLWKHIETQIAKGVSPRAAYNNHPYEARAHKIQRLVRDTLISR